MILRLCGRIGREAADTLREAIQREEGPVVIDLNEVTLVDRDAVPLLAVCEMNVIELRNCPAYIHEWITKEMENG